tara:strand:+ start:1799 stop:3442 length:1644 start_codon:yes stop_codon:yes gene_type:complete
MKFKITLLFLFLVISITGFSQDWKVYPYLPTTSPVSEISFPVDEGRHSDPVEWWYTSGHITTASNKKYSFMLTYFWYPVNVSSFNFDGFRILNLTDESDGTFYQDTKAVNYTTLSTTDLDIEADLFGGGSEYWRNKVDGSSNLLPFEYELNASSASVSINFNLETVKRPLIVGGDGLFDHGLSNYTYYYSQTDNTVTGSLTVDGTTETVTGSAWIDRQYGNFNPFTGEDYEWFSMQLDNGTDLNLWNIFTSSRTIPNDPKYKILSAYVDENQNTQYTISDFEIERLEYFTTPDDVNTYSKKWRLTSASKNIDLVITSNFETSEVNITELSFRFFEGATTISGTIDGVSVTGVGFAELLHKYENPGVSITSPTGGVYTTSNPITWTLNNPDDGRPITYDLEYSIDNQSTFIPIATGLTTTSYTWDGAGISNNDEVWFKIKSYSVDNTLTSEIVSSSSSTATLNTKDVFKNKLQFYPNPVNEELFFELQKPLSNGQIEIIDINGAIISTSRIVSEDLKHRVNLQFLNSGFYFLKLESDAFNHIIKFVKL